MSPDSRRCDRC